MAISEDYLQFVMDQLSDFGDIHSKKMFGGAGIYHDSLMFALVGNNGLYLKVDETNQEAFEAYGMRAFMSSEKKKGLPYWEVPLEILEDKTSLAKWAEKAFQVALNAAKKKK